MRLFQLVLYRCSMRFLSLDNSAIEIVFLLEHVATSLSVMVAPSFETVYWSVEPSKCGHNDLSKCRANNAPELRHHIREKCRPRSNNFSLEYVIVLHVYKNTSYEFLLLQFCLLFENLKCGPFPNVDSIRFLLNEGPYQQFSKTFALTVYLFISCCNSVIFVACVSATRKIPQQ